MPDLCGGKRPLLVLAGISAALAAYALALRPRVLSWGAVPDEVAAGYAGDELIQNPTAGATMATTLPAPPERVWSWLVQMGCGRGGWYSWDFLDNKGVPSTERIVQQWQSLKEGQHLERVANPLDPHASSTNRWTVKVLDPNRTLVLYTSYSLFEGDPKTGRRPRGTVAGSWGFYLEPAARGRTRLVVRTRSRSERSLMSGLLTLAFGEPVHFVMQTRQFHNLRSRLQAGSSRSPLSGGRS